MKDVRFRVRNHGGVAHAIVLALLCTLAAGLILFRPTEVPPLWFDEGWNLLVARNLAENGLFAETSLGRPAPVTYASTGLPGILPLAFSFKLFGVGAWQGRLPGQIITAAALLALYVLSRKLYNSKTATAALFVALFMSGAHIHLHPILLGRQALGEMPALLFLLIGYLCMAAGWRARPGWILAAALFWSLGLSTKAQAIPFFVISLAAPTILLLARRWWSQGGLLAGMLLGSLLCFLAWERLPSVLFPQVMLGETRMGALVAGAMEQRTDTMFDMVFVTDLAPHLQAFADAWPVVLPALAGIGYALVVTARRWRTNARQPSGAQVTGLAVLSLTTSWFAWWLLLSIGWLRYLFPALFLSSIFTAALLHDVTAGFSFSAVVSRTRGLAHSRRRMGWGAAMLAAIAFVVLASITSLRVLGDAYQQISNNSLEQAVDYFNEETPHDALIETFESELFFLLDRPYHYPPNEIQIRLNRRTFAGEDVSVDYDPLGADPQYLVIGPMAKLWKVYDPALQDGSLHLIRQIGPYDVYQRGSGAGVSRSMLERSSSRNAPPR